MDNSLKDDEKKFIQEAANYLEKNSFLMKATQLLGNPIEKTMSMLPKGAQERISETTEKAIQSALQVALLSLKKDPSSHGIQKALQESYQSQKLHSFATALTGAAGGFFGLPALALELPITTTLMLRSIAKTASDFGSDLSDRQTQLDCLFVFSVGSPPSAELKTLGSSYYTARFAFANLAREAIAFMATKGAQELAETLARGTAPILIRILSQLASRFELVVTEKLLAQAIPVAGAATGSMINLLFTEHFNKVAKYHFGLQKLEREYNEETIRALYQSYLG